MDKILHYFPHLSPEQVEQYKALGALYTDWNEKINVISDAEGNKVVLINDIRFKSRRSVKWNDIEEYLKEYSEIDIMTCVDFWKEFCKKFHYEYEEGFTCKGSNGSIRDLKYSVKAASNYFNKAANKTTYYNQCF